MSHWNHRILATKGKKIENGVVVDSDNEFYFTIHEVHYADDGTPRTYAINGKAVSAESITDIKWILDRMQECLSKPVLWGGDRFPEEFK